MGTAISTTLKQIKRSGWLGWASVAIMTLAFLVTTIFGGIFYVSSLFLQSLEQKPQIYAFFEVGTPEDDIKRFSKAWEEIPGVAFIEYTSEEEAKAEFYDAQKDVNELAAQAVAGRSLPASLEVRLQSLDFANSVGERLINIKNENPEIKTVIFSREIIDNIRQVFSILRIGGGAIMALLLIVIILFTLLTVEFRMHSRAEEIEIMQLVGGSLAHIRLPFILEGAFYGLLGSTISNVILGAIGFFVYTQLQSNQLDYIKGLLGGLTWPQIGPIELIVLFVAIIIIGGILGGLNSFIAIRRYIK